MTDLPDTSPNLGLPFYQTKLNEFEVQHNEALLMLDALVMLAVKDRDLSAPPSSPALGDRYLVKAAGTGDFAGKDNRIAQCDIGGWNFYAPQEGWTCYVQDEQTLIAWDGTAWQPALDVLGAITDIENLSLLGIGTTADTTNPLSAKLNNVLWTAKTVAEGGDGTLRYKLSKEDASKTLSFLFQDNFSGCAEVGLTGDDDLHVKVSADGTTWLEAIQIDRTTGVVTFPHNPSSNVPADLDITLAELALGLADALNVAEFLGGVGNRFADSFDALTYVNTGGASNLDTGTAGLLKPTLAATQGTINTNDSTGAIGTYTMIDRTTAVLNSRTVTSIGVCSTVAGTYYVKLVKRNSANSYDVVVSESFSHGGSGWEDHTLSTPYAVPGTGTYYLGLYTTLNTTFPVKATAARAYVNSNITGTGQTTTAEDSANVWALRYSYVSGASNLTVTSTTLTAASAPTTAKLVARVKEIDSVTLNTDLLFYVSRDGGTTYTAFTMTDRFTSASPVANAHVLESNSLDISGQPSGTSMRWKAVTANNKSIELHDIYLYWS